MMAMLRTLDTNARVLVGMLGVVFILSVALSVNGVLVMMGIGADSATDRIWGGLLFLALGLFLTVGMVKTFPRVLKDLAETSR